MPPSRHISFFWKLSSGVVIAALLFGGPLTDAVGILPSTPAVRASGPPTYEANFGTPPAPLACGGALGTGVQCTDKGLYDGTIGRVQNQIGHQLTFAAYLAALNAATYFAQTIAYDTAEWASNGFKGKAPGIYTDPFGDYTKKLVEGAAGEFIGTFSQKFAQGTLGVDLCRPPNFSNLALEFQLGIPNLALPSVARPRPKCAWTDIVSNWDQAASSLSNVEALTNIRSNFTSGGNDLSFGVGAHLAFFDFVADKRYAGVQQRLEGAGYKPVTNFISGKIETPAQTVQKSIEQQIIVDPSMAQNTKTGALLGNAFELGWVQLGVVTASTFTNVLLSRLLSKVQKGLIKNSSSGADLLNPHSVSLAGQRPEELFASQYSDLKTPNITRADAQDLLNELAACPTDGRTVWNCALDESLALALRQGGGVTVQQALDQGFLDGSFPLVPSTRVRDNQDPTCRSRAFCVANLRKLRLARIIPIGWELAAESPANQQSCVQANGCVTLGEVVRQFNNCAEGGLLDATHPYCHLIDPSWVLTAFPAQCQTKGFGTQLLAGTGQRLQECQDTTTCLARDKDGNCTGGYGYCMAEQTAWQFDAPSCEVQFASCRTFMPRGSGAKPVSYLRSTLDYGTCSADNVGCMWYALRRSTTGTDPDMAWSASYLANPTGALPTAASSTMPDRIYFDKNVTPCSASNDGCMSLRRVVPGQAALNLVQNGSFERTGDAPDVLPGWSSTQPDWTYVPPQVGTGAPAADGNQAILVTAAAYGADGVTAMTAAIRPLHQYVLSFYARQNAGAPQGAGVYVNMLQTADPVVPVAGAGGVVYAQSSTCSPAPGSSAAQSAGVTIPATLGDTWTRFTCSFVTPPDTGVLSIAIIPGSSSPLIDAVQLEEGEVPSPFVDGLNVGLATVNMKVPPDELACSGNSAVDSPLCSSFARVCRQNEAGCQGYRPSSGGGSSSEVPAILTPTDQCPAECAGYAEFRKQASTFDLVRSPDPRQDDPDDETAATFIPSTAISCSVQDVGCEMFTNLDVQTQGSEAQSAFRYLRACEKPDGDAQTYYTWEGSDTTGYQLKTWSLKRDISAPLPQPPKIVEKAGPDGVLKAPESCSEATYLQALDPDCRQFYDPQGNVFFRFESQTVLSSQDCRQYRKDGSSQADCEKTGGAFIANTAQCIYQADPKASLQCAPAVAGCRAYLGTQGRAQEEIFFEEFAATPFQAQGTTWGGGSATIALSDESVLVGDQSLRIAAGGGTSAFGAGPMAVATGGLYELTFWANVPSTNNPQVTVRRASSADDGATVAETTDVGTLTLTPGWQIYRMGPFDIPANSTGTHQLQFEITGAPVAFFDKIRVERVQDVAYVVKDSWNTPASCDRTPEGIPSPQAMLGCRAYKDRKGTEVNVRQFTRLCREDVIGCSAYVNTRATESPYATTWTKPGAAVGTNEYTHALGDRYDYFVEDASKFCKADAVSCRAFGKPNFAQDRLTLDAAKPFSTVYLMDDPSKYDDALCSEPELFCEAYSYASDQESGTAYFRAPGTHACEYRTGVVVPTGAAPGINTAGRTYDGWFRVSTDIPCHPDLLQSGDIFNIRFTGDTGFNAWPGAAAAPTLPYRGWGGTCPVAQAECTEFRDVGDTSDPLRPLGRPYYVIRNSQLDTSSCNGLVDPSRGCVLFRDVTDTRSLWNAAATYDFYQTRAQQPVQPVSCDVGSTHPSCAAVGAVANDTNTILKVKPDRSCAEWLSCSTAETVFDPQTSQYKSICTSLALCSKASQPEGAGVPFCSNYVDRTDPAQTLLQQNTVVNAEAYARRRVGFGSKDYSGVTVPNHFQVQDTKLVPIATNLSPDAQVRGRSKKDERLATFVPVECEANVCVVTGIGNGTGRDALTLHGAWEASTEQLQLLAGLPSTLTNFACVFSTNRRNADGLIHILNTDLNVSFGILTDKNGVRDGIIKNGVRDLGEGVLCALSVDQSLPPQIGVAGAPIVSDNLNVPQLLQRFAQVNQIEKDRAISQSFPGATCKAAPEADSPFGNGLVLEWDDTTTPPQPKRVAPGYGQSNFCEFGEACSCTYKRVEYGGASRFYESLSTNVANAVCIGGPRDGQPCALDSGIRGSVPTGNVQANTTTSVDVGALFRGEGGTSNVDRSCGGSGVCRAIQSVKLVRGAIGQCLEYDLSRPVGGDPSQSECLLWSPNPLFAGPGDPYHWVPTAGFQPPQSSGRYYCTSPVREPKTVMLRPDVRVLSGPTATPVPLGAQIGYAKNQNGLGTYAGAIRKFWYDDAITSNDECSVLSAFCDGNDAGGSLDGALASGTDMGETCELTDDEDGQGPSADFNAVRLVTTGKGPNRGYAEYAVLLDWKQIGKVIAGYPATIADSGVDLEVIRENSFEEAVSSFQFSPMAKKLGCAYSQDWVEGIGGIDYDDGSSFGPANNQWHAGFNAEMTRNGGRLDRRNAQIVTEDGTKSGIPVKVKCHNPENESADQNGCFLKAWTLDYRADGKEKFQAFSPDIARSSMDALSRLPVYGKCTSDHPYFSIRAVFEDANSAENLKDPQDVNPSSLIGPFQLVGFWVTACSPGSGPRYIYLQTTMSTADVCRELAETISKDSHDSAVFTDRNWSRGGFTVPRNGFQWFSTNIPFGASLATGDAGEEPLYMSGVRNAGVNPLHPPTFTFAGQTYFRPEQYPVSNWGLLSNVFARIYRIYAYDSRAVSRDDWACTNPQSPNFGQWCPDLNQPDLTAANRVTLSNQFCGFEATCVKSALGGADIFQQKACNSFSGVNRGLDCSSDPDICHRAPMSLEADGVLRGQYGSCTPRTGWAELGTRRWRCTGSCPADRNGGADGITAACTSCATELGCARSVAAKCGAFRCADGTVRSEVAVGDTTASYCTMPNSESQECPLLITAGSEACVLDADAGTGSTGAPGSPASHCENHPWAACSSPTDCHFVANNYWPSGVGNIFFDWATNRQFSVKLGNLEAVYPLHGYVLSNPPSIPNLDAPCGTDQWDDPACIFKQAFMPALPGQAPDGTWFATQRADTVAVNGRAGSSAETLFTLYPGAVPLIGTRNSAGAVTGLPNHEVTGFTAADVICRISLFSSPGTSVGGGLTPSNSAPRGTCVGGPTPGQGCYRTSDCMGPPVGNITNPFYATPVTQAPFVAIQRPTNACVGADNTVDPPVAGACNGGVNGGLACFIDSECPTIPVDNTLVHWGACEPVALMFQQGAPSNRSLGTCRGGARAGATCSVNNDCLPDRVQLNGSTVILRNPNGTIRAGSLTTVRNETQSWCNPAAQNFATPPTYGSQPSTGSTPGQGGNEACWTTTTGFPVASEPDPTLDNNICTRPPGYWPRAAFCKDPTDEYCGLMGFDLTNPSGSQNDAQALPTDVTPGLITPLYNNANGANVGISQDYEYTVTYNPIPPRVAAPDIRTCQGGVCRVSSLGTLNIDSVNEGIVNGGAGSHVAALRFYAWASHEQMPLRRLVIDWGDGNQTELPDAYLKNHKPHCETNKECSLAPGLTCSTDLDCPPGGGSCQTRGSCLADSNKSCSRDAECDTSNGNDGRCVPRVFFGNDGDACEEQYFEFRHAYSCLPGTRPATICTGGSACSSNPDRACATAADCAVGDTCRPNMANVGGCYDDAVRACRFTPRVLLVDNWGWSTGECRASRAATSDPNTVILTDAALSPVLHPNGGCYNPTMTRNNTNVNVLISGVNETALENPTAAQPFLRPWIVFPGSVQVLSAGN